MAEEQEKKLFGRAKLIKTLEGLLTGGKKPENIALVGAEGFGKTAIVKQLFGKDKRRTFLENNQILTVTISAQPTDSMKGFYEYLYISLYDGMQLLEEVDKPRYDRLTDSMESDKRKWSRASMDSTPNEATSEKILVSALKLIERDGLKLVLIFDDFDALADQSRLMKNQYLKMRELATVGDQDDSNQAEGRLWSIFLTSAQKLEKISEEIRSSNFHGVFTVKPIKGIQRAFMEKWVIPELEKSGIEASFPLLNWFERMTGNVPELIQEALKTVVEYCGQGEVFDEVACDHILQNRLDRRMKKWWDKTDAVEKKLLIKMSGGKKFGQTKEGLALMERGCLVMKEDGQVDFATPIFERYIQKLVSEDSCDELSGAEPNPPDDMKEYIKKVIMEANADVNQKLDMMQGALSDMGRLVELIISGIPSKKDFFTSDSDTIDRQKYAQAVTEYTANNFHDISTEKLAEEWRLGGEIWDTMPEVYKNNLETAYRLVKVAYNDAIQNVPGIDCSPAMVMLGKYLEGYLNMTLKPVLNQLVPKLKINVLGNNDDLESFDSLYLGNFKHLLNDPFVFQKICNFTKGTVKETKLTEEVLEQFRKDLDYCRIRRNDADHKEKIVIYSKFKACIEKLFLAENSMTKVMYMLSKL